MEKNNIILTKFLKNLNHSDVYKGLIIASPSKNNPNYFYHWVRDGGICMDTVIKLYEKNIIDKLEFINYFTNYIDAEKKVQALNTIALLGEPKINVDLTPYNESWGRPQNDGPALRCLSIIKYYHIKLDKLDKLLNFDMEIIKSDLLYVSQNYMNPCFDLWEEIIGYHFYTLMVQKKCLEEGMKITNMIFSNEIIHINTMLDNFYTNKYIISSFDKFWKPIRCNDTSIILAFLHTNTEPNLSMVYTIFNIMNIFKDEYYINKNIPYPLVGRYINDLYYNGNPWVLTSIALCRMLNKINKINSLKILFDINPSNIAQSIFNSLKDIQNINSSRFENGLSEQIDKNTGEFIGAVDLTWNYAEYLQYILEHNDLI